MTREQVVEPAQTLEAGPPLVEVHGLTRQYGEGDATVSALAGIDCTIARGEMVALMGPSGSGKSTFMQILGLLDRPTSGTYLLSGQDVSRLASRAASRLRGRRVAFVFQGIHLLPRLTALANVELPLLYARVPSATRRKRALESLDKVGVSHLASRIPAQMSGGQAQRVAIARAIATEPGLLLADEPTGALDRASGRGVLGVFQALNDSVGLTVVMVTHDPFVAQHARRILELEDGRIVGDHTVEDRIVETAGTQEASA